MVLWFFGSMVLWFYGFMVLWFFGSMVLGSIVLGSITKSTITLCSTNDHLYEDVITFFSGLHVMELTGNLQKFDKESKKSFAPEAFFVPFYDIRFACSLFLFPKNIENG